MSRLAGKFAGIVLVAVADERLDALVADLDGAGGRRGCRSTLERTDEPAEHAVAAAPASSCSGPTTPASWPRSPPPSPSATSASRSSAPTCATRRWPAARSSRPAPCSSAPPAPSTEELRSMLEGLADELMVEITAVGRLTAPGRGGATTGAVAAAPRSSGSAVQVRLRPVASGHGRGHDDQDRGHDDGDDPAGPVDAGRAVTAERRVDDEPEQHAPDAAQERQPQRDVVLAAWCDELAEQSDDDPSDGMPTMSMRVSLLPCGGAQ